jgi:protocatechuate 3,4-dioxygenase alpha subunit
MRAVTPPFKETSSQTAGPYVHIGLAPRQAGFDLFEHTFGPVLVTPDTPGDHIAIEGQVFDGSGTCVRDALIELWQANAAGRYAHPADLQEGKAIDPSFRGWGRAATDFTTGLYRFDTIKPGVVLDRQGREMAPHVSLWIVARGINLGLHTRMYFSDESARNASDPVINSIEWIGRRQTLVAERQTRDGATVYRFDIHLQGDHETVFFDI